MTYAKSTNKAILNLIMNKTRPHSNVFKQQYICPVWRMSLLTMGKNIAPLLLICFYMLMRNNYFKGFSRRKMEN